MAGGLLAGVAIVLLFDLRSDIGIVVMAVAAAPIGFNAVTLASLGRMDVEHATASLSVSVTIGLLTATAIVLGGTQWLAKIV